MSIVGTAKPPVGFTLPDDVPGLVRATALALGVARHCKADSWATFAQRVAERDDDTLVLLAGLAITDADAVLIAEHDHVLRLLSHKPLITVAVCPACSGWVLVAGTAPTKCKVTLRCTGKPIKASVATKEKPPADGSDAEPAATSGFVS